VNSGESPSTTPVDVEGASGEEAAPWQSEQLVWSFGAANPRLFGRPEPWLPLPPAPESKNVDGPGTLHEQRLTVPRANPLAPPVTRFGLRSFEALSHWEGIVQRVDDEGFQARLIPYENGKANPTKIEFTDFSWDDLAIPAERDLAVENAVLYWTIGRRRNAAGTYENVSLVRFRRLPTVTGYQRRLARHEAETLLRALGNDGSG
jgi:hypothetical protein